MMSTRTPLGKFTRAALLTAGVQVVGRISALLLGIILARTLGTDGYGIYAYVFAVMSLLLVGAEMGVPVLAMREVSAFLAREQWASLRGVIIRSLQFVLVVSLLVAVIAGLAIESVDLSRQTDKAASLLIMLLILPMTALTSVLNSSLRGMNWVVGGQWLEAVLRPLIVICLVGIIFHFEPAWREPQYAMLCQLLAAAIVLVVFSFILRRKVSAVSHRVTPKYETVRWLRDALPFTLIGGASVINGQADLVMLGWLTTNEEVGVYRVATQGALLVAFGLQAINTVVASRFAQLYSVDDKKSLEELARHSSKLVFIASLPIAAIFFVWGGDIAATVFGIGFEEAYLPLVILAVGQLINAAFGSVGFLLNMTGYERETAKTLWQTSVLNIVLNAALIPTYGTVGAAIATALSLAVWNALLYLKVRTRLGINSTFIGGARIA